MLCVRTRMSVSVFLYMDFQLAYIRYYSLLHSFHRYYIRWISFKHHFKIYHAFYIFAVPALLDALAVRVVAVFRK